NPDKQQYRLISDIALLAGGRLKLHNAINIREVMTRRKPQIAPPFLKPTCFTSKYRARR
ncbi:hypothetical protein PC120_g27343, partial [Phytophthora cactorum]